MGKSRLISAEDMQKAVDFHGHSCPGLAIGSRVAELCLRELGHNSDTPIVAICETDMCGVDAIQALTGCSVGKGNLILKDHGKMAFTFFRRNDGKGFRALLNPEISGKDGDRIVELMKKSREGASSPEEQSECIDIRAAIEQRYLETDLEDLFTLSKPQVSMPRPAKILQSVVCATCGEKTMESRSRRYDGQFLCIPCFEMVEQKV